MGIGRISSSDGNLERWESEGFFAKEIIEKAFTIAKKEKWAFWVQTSNGYISDKTCDFLIIFFTKNSPDYQQSNVWSPEKIRLKLIFFINFF